MSNYLFSDCKTGDWAVVPNIEIGQRIARGLGVTDYVIEPEPRREDALEPFTYKPPFVPAQGVPEWKLNAVLGAAVLLSFASGVVFAAGYLGWGAWG